MPPGPNLPVDGRPAAPPRVGLLATITPTEEKDPHWENGFSYLPETCASATRANICDSDDDVDIAGGRTQPGEVTVQPVAIIAEDDCSAVGWNARNYVARAKRALAACESFQLAEELWTGSKATDGGFTNNPILAAAGADILTSDGGLPPLDALSCLEFYLARCNCGQRGMIHATRDVVTHWVQLGALERQGSTLVTKLDTFVIPDGGYPGTGPAEAVPTTNVQWAFATGMVDVRLGDVEIFPKTFEEAFDRQRNNVSYTAQRIAAASFDPCCRAAAGVQVETCSVGS